MFLSCFFVFFVPPLVLPLRWVGETLKLKLATFLGSDTHTRSITLLLSFWTHKKKTKSWTRCSGSDLRTDCVYIAREVYTYSISCEQFLSKWNVSTQTLPLLFLSLECVEPLWLSNHPAFLFVTDFQMLLFLLVMVTTPSRDFFSRSYLPNSIYTEQQIRFFLKNMLN